MYYFVEVSCVIAEMWMIHLFLSSFFERRNYKKLLPILFYMIAGVTVTALSLIEGLIFARLIVAAVSVFLICISLFGLCFLMFHADCHGVTDLLCQCMEGWE